MGRKQVHQMFDELTWTQFQAFYPRQATKIFEETMRTMINMKLEISDEQGEQLMKEKAELQKVADDVLNQLKERELKIQAYQAKKREEVLQEKKSQQEFLEKAQMAARAMKAAGAAERFRFQ